MPQTWTLFNECVKLASLSFASFNFIHVTRWRKKWKINIFLKRNCLKNVYRQEAKAKRIKIRANLSCNGIVYTILLINQWVVLWSRRFFCLIDLLHKSFHFMMQLTILSLSFITGVFFQLRRDQEGCEKEEIKMLELKSSPNGIELMDLIEWIYDWFKLKYIWVERM